MIWYHIIYNFFFYKTDQLQMKNSSYHWTQEDYTSGWAYLKKEEIMSKLNVAQWCIYASVNYIIIGSDNGLSPACHRAII